ncbi:non-ribosomal peptide synthetase, partial [Plesiocystis pacifica SIR-1]
VAAPGGFRLEREALGPLSEAGVVERLRAEARRPLDLEQGPSWRALVLEPEGAAPVLLLVFHHLFFDGLCIPLVLGELARLHAAARAGDSLDAALPAPAGTSFDAFVRWQRERLDGEGGEELRRFWAERFPDAPPTVDLRAAETSLDARRRGLEGAHLRLDLPAEVVAGVEALAAELGTTPFVLTLAVWLVLLRGYGRSDELCVGVPAMSRPSSAFEALVGYFSNVVVIRQRLDAGRPFSELVEAVHDAALDAVAHGDYPLAELIRENDLRGKADFFQAAFYFQNWFEIERAAAATTPLWTEYLGDVAQEGEFELVLEIHRFSERWRLFFKYDPAVHDAGSIARMAGRYRNLLDQVLADARRPVDQLQLPTPSERARVLGAWSRPESEPAPVPAWTVPERFAELAGDPVQGARVALRCAGEVMSYAELHARASAVAVGLRRRGVGRGSVVGVMLERSSELVVGLLGVLMAGAAYLPLDPIYPEARLRTMLEDSGAALLLVDAFGISKPLAWPGSSWRAVELGACVLSGERASDSALPAPTGEDLAYLIYTSGSTGRPKGVPIRHESLANLLAQVATRPGFGPDDRMLAATTVCFDIAMLELFLPLTQGGELVLMTSAEARDGQALVAQLESGAVSVAQATPATWRMALAAGWRERAPVRILCGGEALPADLAQALLSRCDALWNMYGPTEATIWASCDRVRATGPVTIGRPLGHYRLYILDDELAPVAPGLPGDLYIGGVALSPGYHGRPELDAKTFVANPHDPEDAPRLYRTGDVARFLSDGRVEWLRRADDQVKILGYRVELGEIDAALRALPGIADAAAVIREDSPGVPRIVAYVVRSGSGDEASWRAALGERLPSYMIPRQFVAIEALPLSHNLKVDRKRLAQEPLDSLAPEKAPTAPAPAPAKSSLVEALGQLCAELMGIPGQRLDPERSLFSYGFNSITATQLRVEIARRWGRELELVALAEGPSVASVAAMIGAGKDAAAPAVQDVTAVGSAGPADAPFALTPIQEAYLAGRLLAEEGREVGCHIYVELDATGFTPAALGAGWQALIDGHQALRTVILPSGREQAVLPGPRRYTPEHLVLDGLDQGARESRVEALRARMEARLYDPQRWPLFEVAIVTEGPRTRVHLSIDNLFVDGASLVNLLAQWSRLARGESVASLGLPSLSFRDYCVALERGRSSGALAERRARDLDYWVERLRQQPEGPRLPYLPQLRRREPRGRRRYRGELEPARFAALEALARGRGVTPTAVLLAAFQLVLRAWSEDPNFSLILTLFQRAPLHPEVDAVVGSFTSTSIFHVEAPAVGSSLAEQARAVHRQLWTDLSHDAASGVDATREYHRRHRSAPSSIPVVFTSLVGHVGHERDPALAGWIRAVAGEHARTQTPDVALDHQVFDVDGRLHYFWDVDEDRFVADVPALLFRDYEAVLDALLAEPEAFTEQPTQALLPRTLDALFLRQAARTPAAVAVIAADRRLSYAQLRGRVVELAHRLVALGVARGDRVAVVARKGWEQVVAALAVNVAGAAYVPIDPTMPAARLGHIVEFTEARVALTQSSLDASLSWPVGLVRVCVDAMGDGRAFVERELPQLERQPTDLAYVIFTSGSTGTPKGVMLDHRGPVNTILDVNARFEIGPADRTLAVSSLGFDLSVYDLFGLLAVGGAVVVPEPEDLRDPLRLAELVEAHAVTIWNTVPAYADLLEEAARGSAQLRSLRVVMMSGDWIPVGLPDRLRAQCPAAAITSLGGATEASIWSILYPIDAVDPSWKSIPYGAAMVAQPWCLIDEDGQVVDAVGVPAQLHIGGVGVALGYWRNPDKTGAAFIAHPETGERIYATGDRGQLRADGNYEFLGRIDRQVKLNGYRIELGEIEATLQRCEGVARALVLVLGDGQARHLGAFVEAEAGAGAGPSEAELVALAKQWLPTYMQPKTYACVRRLQLTANGKVDRRVSPEQLEAERVPFEGATSSPAPSALAPAPATPSASPESVFAELAAVAAELLGAAVEGPQVDLFELGATSLTIMRLVQRVRERFGVRVPAGRLFESPRLETLVQAVVAAQPKPAAAKAEPSPEAETEAETEAEPEAEPSLLLTHARREAFKARQLHLRTLRAEQRVELSPARLDAPALAARNQTRRSVRRFGAGPVSQGALSSLLEAARVSVAEDGSGSTKAAYPSAGHLYAVQIYVEVKAGRVEGLAGGVYYYHPVEHALARLSEAALPSTAHVAHNREIHRSGAFVLHLIAAMDAVEPLYGEASETLVTLDAGYLGQHFYAAAGPLGLGLCAIGTLDFEALRAHFELDATHRHVHALVGGVDPRGASASPGSRGEATATAKVEVIPEAQASSARAPAQAEPIAIVGLAGRYPGVEGLDGPEGLWSLIESGGHRVGAPPAARGWSEADSRGVRAGFLDDIARFEPLFFRISPREAATMDPQERLFLEVAWQALEDAGYTPESLRARLGGEAPVGVYAGVMSHQYALCGDAVPAFHHAIANRVSWCFDLDGPSLAVDTACSASLSAIHLAVQAIRAGECRWALAGGVNLSLHPSKFRYMQRMRLSSPSGRCSTFGAGADGIVTGEGAGVIVLKPLSAALADGDHVHALIRGTALNHTGKTRAFTVPDSAAQGALIRQAIEDAGVDPSSISHVETHGTGTALGDPIEIRGLNKAWEEVEAPPTGVVLGSLKPNLGHLESAAGVASLTRVLLQMRHRTLAPTPSAAEPNPELELEGSPFVLPTRARAWAPRDAAGRELPLRAGLSSFGAGGANAHLVLEAFDAKAEAGDSDANTLLEGPWILPLSAGTPEQRQRLAERTREHLAQGCWDARALRDLCFTLQVGRRHHGHRGVVIGSSVVEFDAGLELLAQGEIGPQAWVRTLGSGHERADAEAAPSMGADAETHARAWLTGAALDWAALPVNRGARRRPAPVYPFAGARHWVEAPAATEAPAPAPAPAPALVARDSEPSALAASVEIEVEVEAGAEPVCFEPAFEAADARPEGPAPSRVLLVDPRVARADRWRLQLPVIHVRPVMGGAWEEDEDGRFRVDPTRPGALERLLEELGEPDTIVWVHDERNPGREQGLRALLRTLGARRPRPARVMILAPAASLGEAEGLDGLVATAAAEWPEVCVKLVALEASAPAEIVDPALLDELRDPTRVVGFDDRGHRQARSWRQAAPSEAPSVRELVARWPADAGVVIAGGMGGFGRTLALHLAQAGVARLVLLGRSALDEDGRRHLDALEAAGARALYLPVDIADASALLGLRGILERACPQLRGVIHCATTHYDAPLGAADLDRWAQLEATKLAGAEHLDALTAGAELDFFVVCSSLIGLVGNRGQGAYARANGQLNDFAHARARAVARGERRGASASLCLPLLAGGGMRPTAQTLAAMAKAGL